MSSAKSGHSAVRAVVYALLANAGIAIAKFAAALYTGSGAMLAEAIHSLADCANQMLLLWGMRRAKQEPNVEHPLGFGRVVYFYAMLVALLLFLMGGAFSVYEGVHRLRSGQGLTEPYIALAVLAVSIVLEGFSLAGALREIRIVQGGRNLWHWFRETRQSELLVVAGEDIAALAGLTFAFVAVLLAMVTGNPTWDSVGSIVIGLLLMTVAFLVMREVQSMIVGESAEPALRAEIEAYIVNRPEVESVISLITLQWGENLVVAVQAQMRPQDSAETLIAAINLVEEAVQTRWPVVKWLFFEPDSVRPAVSSPGTH